MAQMIHHHHQQSPRRRFMSATASLQLMLVVFGGAVASASSTAQVSAAAAAAAAAAGNNNSPRTIPSHPLPRILSAESPFGLTSLQRSRHRGLVGPFQNTQNTCKVSSSDGRISTSSSSSSSSSSALQLLRGGEISLPDQYEDDNDEEGSGGGGLVLSKIRNVIRSLLEIGDRKSPTVSSFMRSLVRTLEKLTGMKLLPKPKTVIVETSSKSKKKKKNKKINKAQDDEDEIITTKEKTSKAAGEARSSNPTSKPQAATSLATKKHLTSTIKSTNPNHRIQQELKQFIKSPPDNLSVQVGTNIRIWIITMVGAKGTLYEGETFKLRVSFPPQYPTVPPSVYFLKGHIPRHEHVYTNGDICLSLLGKDWRPTMTAQSVAVSILSILSSAQIKTLPMDNAKHANAKPGEYQKDWVYHDDNC